MPKHAFKSPRQVLDGVKKHVEEAVRSIDAGRFNQEPHYTTSLITRLEGTAYEGEYGLIRFEVTAFDDRAPNSAEWRWGADFAITATVSDGSVVIEKAILVQAKLGKVEQMSPSSLEELKDQIRKMRKIVSAPKVMEILAGDGFRDPRMISGNRILEGGTFRPLRLADYVVARITTTLDGATDLHIVQAVKSSRLDQLNLVARLKGVPATPPF